MSLLFLMIAAIQTPEKPLVRRENFSTTTRGPQLTREIVPFVKKYYECLMPPGVVTSTKSGGKSTVQVAQERLDACSGTRKWAVASSMHDYKAERGDKRSARNFVNSAFETIDKDHLKQAQFVDDIIAGKAQLPEDPSKPINLDNPPAETGSK